MAAKVAASAAAATAFALYANAKTGFTTDLQTLRDQKIFARNLTEHISRCGPNSTSLYRMLELADPNADGLWFEGRSWNFRAMKAEVDNLALGLVALRVKDGDVVAVFMTNSPEMVFIVYALTKLGAVPALINSHLRDDTLLHCVRLGASRLIVSTPDIAPYAASAAKSLSEDVKTVTLNLGSFRPSESAPGVFPFPSPTTANTDPITVPPPRTMASPAAFIFTSGTTGKPKACSIKNALIMFASCPSAADCPASYSDRSSSKYFPLRTYSCMPLFHGTTFLTGLCYSVGTSSCFCVSRKFSARNFWKEITESRTTRALYVGELCRFLLATPEGEYDRKHKVTVAAGNGLQRDVWVAFQRRFGVGEIREYYRSTEGLVKYDNRHFAKQGFDGAGKVGFQGTLVRRKARDQFIVRFDYETEMPVRDAVTGWCIKVGREEPGEGIARIGDMGTYTDYYGNREATEKKIMRDVFEKGDVWQRSGDLLMQEASGWVRFVDRIGDTFRWKGENVSAGEIRAYISEFPEVQDVVVVGRVLKGYDGQAGVAAISLESPSGEEEKAFMDVLYGRLKKKGVPSYAFPRLVAITDEIKVGDTFKHAKQIVKGIEWGDVAKGKRYYLDVATSKYVLLDSGSWGKIETGLAKL